VRNGRALDALVQSVPPADPVAGTGVISARLSPTCRRASTAGSACGTGLASPTST